MTTRRTFLTLGTGAAIAVSLPNFVFANQQNLPIKLTALSQIFGDGAKWVGVAIEFEQPLKAEDIPNQRFQVQDRHILGLYVTDSFENGAKSEGKFVVLNLDPDDANANLVQTAPLTQREAQNYQIGEKKENAPSLKSISQRATINGLTLFVSDTKTAIMDEFKQEKWTDSATGKTIRYNLFTPNNYDPKQKYPLVLFMHDEGITGTKTKVALYQGLGAISWASPSDQAKHPAFILAPEFDEIVVDDKGKTSDYLETTINLIKYLSTQYTLDENRYYSTGQSSGGALSMAMNVKYPDFFAASYLVACQWDNNAVTPMAKNKLWITVSEDDHKVLLEQRSLLDVLEKNGAKVARASWNAQWSQEEFQQAFNQLTSVNANVYFVVFEKGSIFTDKNEKIEESAHRNTWKYAYSIEPIRDWIFEQRKN
ncbi:putative peptidase [Pasteurella langaaensis DSM 22999]|uniref:Acyl-CoA:diacylglycerol acyltransferase n=1 Tax=Alitibacter langaaensis DSM 22999 TaxID=1122935 RepID=A0A2U0SMU5_9PAST|nr:PHB depolymerase family esterase [Pasteurella langaaensis]PVX32667.1 putative peptidase [Pasteurella langaaensis DSM 22999]